MDQDRERLLRNHVGDVAYAYHLARGALRARLDAEPGLREALRDDLNPHLVIHRICREIAEEVSRTVPCEDRHVMLLWLTSSWLGGDL